GHLDHQVDLDAFPVAVQRPPVAVDEIEGEVVEGPSGRLTHEISSFGFVPQRKIARSGVKRKTSLFRVKDTSKSLPLEGLPVQSQYGGGFGLVSGGELEDARDVAALDGGEVEGLRRGQRRRAEEGADEDGVDLLLGERDGALDQVLELAHVAGEVVGEEE